MELVQFFRPFRPLHGQPAGIDAFEFDTKCTFKEIGSVSNSGCARATKVEELLPRIPQRRVLLHANVFVPFELIQTALFNRFVRFLATELKPHIDAGYRTLPDRGHTFLSGFSLGGVLALYGGWQRSETFGAVAPQSGSFWVPNFTARVLSEPRPNLRVYCDAGTAEATIYPPTFEIFTSLAGRQPPAVVDRQVRFRIGFNHGHTYPLAGRRMADMLRFLYPAQDEIPVFPAGFTGRPVGGF